MSKLIYIAGPYGDSGGYLQIERNIARAREAAAELAAAGVGYLCPHLNSAHFEAIVPDVPREFWLELGLRLLKGCDAILMLPGWYDSKGSCAEWEEAERLGLPMFYDVDGEAGDGEWDALREWAKT